MFYGQVIFVNHQTDTMGGVLCGNFYDIYKQLWGHNFHISFLKHGALLSVKLRFMRVSKTRSWVFFMYSNFLIFCANQAAAICRRLSLGSVSSRASNEPSRRLQSQRMTFYWLKATPLCWPTRPSHMTFAPVSQFHVYLLWVVKAFSMIVKLQSSRRFV